MRPRRRLKVLHFADLHLEAAFPWAGAEAGRRRRGELLQTLGAIIDLADEVAADAIVSAGNLYDAERAGPDTLNALQAAFERAEPRQVVLLPGTADPDGRTSIYRLARWTGNVRVVGGGRAEPIELREGVRLWAGFDFSGFEPEPEVVDLALFHGLPPAGFAHAMGGGRRTPEDGPKYTFPGAPAALAPGEPEGSAVVYSISTEGQIAVERRTVSTGVVPVPPVTGAAWLDALPEDAYDLATISVEQTVRGDFLRDVLASDLPRPLARRTVIAGLRAFDGDLEEAD